MEVSFSQEYASQPTLHSPSEHLHQSLLTLAPTQSDASQAVSLLFSVLLLFSLSAFAQPRQLQAVDWTQEGEL